MNPYFYFYGIIYILYHAKGLYDVISFNYKRDVVDKIGDFVPDKITRQNIDKQKSKLIESVLTGFAEGIAIFLTSIFNLMWIIAGAMDAVEVYSFGTLFIISVLSSLILLVYAVNTVIKNRKKLFNFTPDNPRQGILSLTNEVQHETPYKTIWNVIDRGIRIGIGGFILYSHFFTSI